MSIYQELSDLKHKILLKEYRIRMLWYRIQRIHKRIPTGPPIAVAWSKFRRVNKEWNELRAERERIIACEAATLAAL